MDSAEIIYLEVDAEITEAIDKLKGAKTDAVKIVVPARSSLLQSAVNLKLLKKSAKDHSKEIALVTTDKTARYLAGGIGLAVASSVKATPEVPEAREEEIEPDIVGPEPAEAAAAAVAAKAVKEKKSAEGSKPSGSKSSAASAEEPDEAVVRRRPLGEEAEAAGAVETTKTGKSAKVPNYSAFQKKLGIGAIIAVVIVAFIAMMIFLPTGKVTLLAKANKLSIDSKFIVDSSTTENDASSLTYAGQKLELAKDLTANFTATGKKDVGTKATGTVKLTNASSPGAVSLPAGTILTAQGKSYTLDKATTVPAPTIGGPPIHIVPGQTSATITATANGDSYNLGTTTFAVSNGDGVTASGSTSGGTSKTATVVTQGDVDKAKQQAIDGDASTGKDALFAKADKQSEVFEDTFATNADSVSSSAPVDSENANGTVTVKVKYSVLTATNDTLNSMLDTLAKADLPDGEQQLYQNGLEDAKFSLVKAINDTKTQLQVTTSAYYGKKIDTSKVAKSVAGKSKKDVTTIAQQDNPSVTGSEVETTPSLLPWMPSLGNRIKVTIRVSTQ